MRKLLLLFAITAAGLLLNAQDAKFEWAGQIGGTSVDEGYFITIDGAGNVYTTGDFRDTVDFDPGAGVYNLISDTESADIFLSKLDSSGNFIWAKRMGGKNNDYGISITIDEAGSVYVTGVFIDTVDFDPGTGIYNIISTGQMDIFICKLDSSGNFKWAEQIGGTNVDYARSIAIDGAGNIYLTGVFEGVADFDPGPETYEMTSAGDYDIFISRLDSSGNFKWAKQFGGVSYDVGESIATDQACNVYTTGFFMGTIDFDPGAGVCNLVSAGGSEDIFISKLDSSGNFRWAKRMGGTDRDMPISIATDGAGNVYTTGNFEGIADFNPGAETCEFTVIGNNGDIFISKLDSSGDFVWAKQIGGEDNDVGESIVTDEAGNVYTTGIFSLLVDFDPGTEVYELASLGSYEIFVSKLDSSGNFVWAKRIGEADTDGSLSIAVDGVGNIYTTGFFRSTVDFDPGAEIHNLTSAGDYDIFIQKMSPAASGIEDIYNNEGIVIYPNPTNGTFNLSMNGIKENVNVSILNIQGQVIYSEEINASTYNYRIDLSAYPKGIYFIKLTNDNINEVRKIIVG